MLQRYYHKKSFWLTGFIIWTIIILTLSMIPDSHEIIQDHSKEFRWDYLEHFIAFFVFGTFFILWRGNTGYFIPGRELMFIIILSFSFAVLTEILQKAIPGRTCNPVDMIYNLAGVLSSFLLVYLYIVRRYLRKTH